MSEIDLQRANNLIDPHLHFWGWEIPVYLFLGGVTAGVMILSAVLGSRISDANGRSRAARLLPFAAPVLLSLGMLALLLDLNLKSHVYRFYMTLRPSSPMSWGSWLLVLVYPATILLGLANLTDAEAQSVGRALRLGSPIRYLRSLVAGREAALRKSNVVLGVGLGTYTGVLLGTLGARPVWNSAVFGPLFLVSGVSGGAAVMMLFSLSHTERQVLRRWEVLAIVVELSLLALFLLGLATGGGASQEAGRLFMGGRFTAAFWALVVVAGLAVPALIEGYEGRRGLRPTVAAPALVLLGGLSLRWILVLAGQA